MDINDVPREFFVDRAVEALERVDRGMHVNDTGQFRKQQAEAVVEDIFAALEVVSAVQPRFKPHGEPDWSNGVHP